MVNRVYWLEPRQKAAELASELFDTEITVDLREEDINIDKEMEANPSNYGLLNELTKEKEALEEELLYKYERVEYLEDLAKKIEEYKKK